MKLCELFETLDEVAIDNREGAGAVPDNLNVDYLGLRVQMKPSMFLKLAAKLGTPQSAGQLADYIKQGGAIGAPFLDIQIPDEWLDTEPDYEKPARIAGHEGRNRMIAVQRVEGDAPVEVHLFFRGGLRRRHLTPEIIELLQYNEKGIYNQDKKFVIDSPLFELQNKQPLNELFAKPYEFEVSGDTYTFETASGNRYTVLFEYESVYDKDIKQWFSGPSVVFGLSNRKHEFGMKIEKTGDAFNVFATVGLIVKQYLSQNPRQRYVIFAADKSEPSRLKLYNAFMQIIPQVLPGFKPYKTIDNFDNEFRFYILEKKVGNINAFI